MEQMAEHAKVHIKESKQEVTVLVLYFESVTDVFYDFMSQMSHQMEQHRKEIKKEVTKFACIIVKIIPQPYPPQSVHCESHRLLFHECDRQNFVQPFLRSRKLLRLYTCLD